MDTKPPFERLMPDLSAPVREPDPPEMQVAADATPLDFLCAVYRDPAQPMARRMKAAEVALPFTTPKLSAVALGGSFAAEMKEIAKRRYPGGNVIDSLPAPDPFRKVEVSGD